jgi:group I intron endonuclease
MNSGIYKLVFTDKSVYIGKSVDMSKRWDQHLKALKKGTHTKRIQDAYNKYGTPKFEIICECHPHHIDILETYFINGYWSPKILNTTRPADVDALGISLIDELPEDTWDLSTFEYIQKWIENSIEVKRLEKLIRESKDATILSATIDSNKSLLKELQHIKNRGFFARLFNWY